MKWTNVAMALKILQSDFEVFGIVQGVSFRMYTQRKAKELDVRGWCMNTSHDTVKGQIQASLPNFEKMKTWLEKTGSPTSRIDKVVYSNNIELDNYTFDSFEIRK